MKKDKKIFWFDLETSGLDKIRHGITQIAALVEVNGEVVDEFESKVMLLPDKKMTKDALDKTGFTPDQLRKDFPHPFDVYENLGLFCAKYSDGKKENRFIMAGYNAQFDCERLQQWHDDISGGPFAYWNYFQHAPIDPLPMLRLLNYAGVLNIPEGEKISLESACKCYGIELKAHNALSDIRATRQLSYVVYEKELNLIAGKKTCNKQEIKA